MARHRLIDDDDRVLIGLSGGPDSVALLHVLSRLKKRMHLTLAAVYVNHQMRPRTALKEEKFCQALCDKLDVTLIIVREDVPSLARRTRCGLEETARDVRYAVFDRLIREQGHDRVALGHQADDQVETILFRLVRGTGPYGLTGMPIKRGKYVRPLLEVSRAEILEYLRAHALTWCEDASNRSVRFKRNWIRNRLLPLLRQELNPRVDEAILALADTLAEDESVLEDLIVGVVSKCVGRTPGGKIELALNKYGHYAKGIRRRLLRHCVKASCPNRPRSDKETIQRLDDLAMNQSGALSLPDGLRAVVAGEKLFIWLPQNLKAAEPLEPGRALSLEWPAVRFTSRIRVRPRTIDRTPGARRVRLDWDRVQPPLEVRSLRPGDRFRPLGMKGRKKVSDWLADRKVPRPLREEVLLLCDRLGPVWIVGHEIADRAKVDAKTRRVLTVAVSIRKETEGAAV